MSNVQIRALTPTIQSQSQIDEALINLLTPNEREQYSLMVHQLSISIDSSRCHTGLPDFINHINMVHQFISKGDSRDAIRGNVCGIQFGRGFILVNTSRLKRILQRSKSCMNGCFQKLGYGVMRPSHDIISLFTQLMPKVNPELFGIRQWCVRLVGEKCLICFAPHLPDSATADFEADRLPQQLRKTTFSIDHQNNEVPKFEVITNFQYIAPLNLSQTPTNRIQLPSIISLENKIPLSQTYKIIDPHIPHLNVPASNLYNSPHSFLDIQSLLN